LAKQLPQNFMIRIFSFTFFLISLGSLAQQTDSVDFIRIEAGIETFRSEKRIEGKAQVTFKTLKEVDSVYLDAIAMEIEYKPKGSIVMEATDKKIWFKGKFSPNKEYKVQFFYKAEPKQTLYFTGDQIWTQGQGKYTSHWLPSIDDMNDKIEFDLMFIAPEDETVISNGKLISKDKIHEVQNWRFDMQKPMSSYLAAFVIGKFSKKEIRSSSGVPIELYYKPEDSLKAEPTYRHTKEIFDFLESEIGVPYPWKNYKQVPVRDFLYAGMENTTATIFSEAFLVDSIGYNDRNYVNINAHELTHHWFGNLVTENSGTHHWLQEGFATYYAHLVEKELFGDDYYYWMLYQSAEQLKELSDQGKGESLLNPGASSLTFYEKGAWALHILRELIGDDAFRTAIRSYLKKHKFSNVTTEDFLAEVRAASPVDITSWEEDWLQQSAFKAMQAYNSLTESEFMDQYLQVAMLRSAPASRKINELSEAIAGNNDFIGQEAVYQPSGDDINVTASLYEMALTSDNLYIRQAVAVSSAVVAERLKDKFEELLVDKSYVTIEAALFALWSSFPEEQGRYLDKTKDVVGFQDKNVRQLWLALAIITEGYRTDEKPEFISELRNYSGDMYSFEIRQKAFEYINQLGLYNEAVVDNLINASVHHNWRFRNASRNLFSEILKNPGTIETLVANIDRYTMEEQLFLKSKLNKE
jgi:aminopeptidase N